jgi:hypothetical protein
MSEAATIEPADLRALAEQSNAWPFEEAKKIVARLKRRPKDEVIFETGYEPSGRSCPRPTAMPPAVSMRRFHYVFAPEHRDVDRLC